MSIWQDLSFKLKNNSIFYIGIFLSVYFAFHTVTGDRGFIRMVELQDKLEASQQISSQYLKEKNELESKVKLLSSNSLDRDMLEERSRVILNVIDEDEFVIFDN